MPWFKVDDGLSTKVETTRIPRAHRPAAIGLWALAGSWSARELTDGHIPAHMIEELAGTPGDAQRLVDAGYWAIVDAGFQFVTWGPDQPLREPTLERRRKNTEKVANWRSRNRGTDEVTNHDGDQLPTLPPTRPDPTTTSDEVVDVHHDARAGKKQGYSSEFEEFWSLYPRRQAKKPAAEAFARARKKHSLETIMSGLRSYALMNAGGDKTRIKLAAGWLNDERFTDEEQLANEASASKPQRATVTPIPPRELAECSAHPGYPPSGCPRCAEDRMGGAA
ncbi:hypothetical protein [Agromyces albus]|uniref:hypothetical protein n=1 Tax=Agromyces albus TaxID=205332 RepID=UPI0027884A37|nr:hypothetical protein [Agromyces albus]MDQ0576466.1 hypothetical protein [Agromyces albus]